MRILVMTKLIADKITGIYQSHKGNRTHSLIPIKIKEDVYIIELDAIIRIKHKLKHSKYADIIKTNVKWFTTGDGSNLDLKYQQWLISQQIEV